MDKERKNQHYSHSHRTCEANTCTTRTGIPAAGTEQEGKVEGQPQNVRHKWLTNRWPIITEFILPFGQSSMLGAKVNTKGY